MTIPETAIEIALRNEIDSGGFTWPIAWPNHTVSNNKPYILFEIVRVGRRDDTLAGEMTISRGQIIGTPVTKVGVASDIGNQKADEIAALFPMGRRITVNGGEILIIKPPDIREGFRQDAEWRTPVIIDYEAF